MRYERVDAGERLIRKPIMATGTGEETMAKVIMVQGTMSNAGKSLLVAGLCRIFRQDGYRVAPFKSQNMALNSFITTEGLEMGRAQVMQAEAAGIEPSVRMNPILLKPTNDIGSQVIVNGEVLGTMSARDYFKYKKKLVPDIMKAYDKLASENDIIVIEGAGSPAEINLKTEDTIRENFITDGTVIKTPYGININPYSNNVYITEARDYTTYGDLLCFNQQGQLMFRLNNIGLNPNTIAFSDKASQSDIDDNDDDKENPLAFANKVWEYRPAPGQFINTTTSAYKEGFTYDDILEEATRRIQQKSLLTLGGFGGYIVLGFPHPIPNVTGEYDFKIKGNAYYNSKTGTGALGGSAEPGIVFVSKDVNGNGKPDDEWYELKGSEYGKDTETRGYEITYHRPNPANLKVFWKDNQGNEGYIFRNSFHNQESYYPLWIESDEITFQGTRLKDNAVPENGLWVGYCYPWGYADNHPNSKEGSNFKIDWAVDSNGSPVDLDQIDFVKIMTAVNQDAGQMGEISTEVTTIENLHFKK